MSYQHSIVIHLGSAYTGKTLYARFYDENGNDYGDEITSGITELTGGQGIYIFNATIPDGFTGGLKFYAQGTTEILAAGSINPETTEGKVALKPTGMDSIAVTDPGSPAAHTTIPKMIVALWRTVYKKVTETATHLKHYADDGESVNATSLLSDDGTTKTKGAAE